MSTHTFVCHETCSRLHIHGVFKEKWTNSYTWMNVCTRMITSLKLLYLMVIQSDWCGNAPQSQNARNVMAHVSHVIQCDGTLIVDTHYSSHTHIYICMQYIYIYIFNDCKILWGSHWNVVQCGRHNSKINSKSEEIINQSQYQ